MRTIALLSGLLGGLFFCGCGTSYKTPGVSDLTDVLGISGSVHGGQQPVVGASVMLMLPGSTYGGTPSVLASTTTLAGGAFSLPAYTCPANSGLVYLLATGGDSGSGTNAALAEAAVLGPCSSLTPATFTEISEVTTVAAAYVLAPFATVTATGTGIGAPVSNQQGLTNAFGAAGNLANLKTGFARAPGELTGVVPPQAEMNTLANILASCVNTTGSTAANAACGKLFAAATPSGGVAPVDTFQAALDIALNPGANASTLFGLSVTNAPFQPVLATASADFALGIEYTGGGINGSYGTNGIAIDAAGDAWIAAGDEAGNTGYGHTLVEITPAGVYQSGTSGYGTASLTSPEGVAIDSASNVYVTDLNLNYIREFSSNGLLQVTFVGSVPHAPMGIAIDTDSTFWVVSSAQGTIAHLATGGLDVGGSPYSTQAPGTDVVLNTTGNWTDEYGASTSGYLTNYRNAFPNLGEVSVSVSNHPAGIALDNGGNLWYSADMSGGGGTLGRLSPTYSANLTAVAIAAPLTPQGVFIDGLGNVWVSTYNSASAIAPSAMLEYSNTGALISPASGYSANGTLSPSPGFPGAIAVDGSGNLWLTGNTPNPGGGTQPNAYVTELIGIAAPVVTPIAVAAANGTLGTRP